MKGKTLLVMFLVSMMTSSLADAATASYRGRITKILTNDTNYGGCMFYTSPGPQSTGLSCKNNYITGDCVGSFTTKANANATFNTGQLAYVSGLTNVRFDITDSEKHNGYCRVKGIIAE